MRDNDAEEEDGEFWQNLDPEFWLFQNNQGSVAHSTSCQLGGSILPCILCANICPLTALIVESVLFCFALTCISFLELL